LIISLFFLTIFMILKSVHQEGSAHQTCTT
jgi:hypothetical protein